MRWTVTAIACVCLFATALHASSAQAAPVFDDQRGTAKDTFNNFNGVESSSGVLNDTTAAIVRLATPNDVGSFLTLPYEPVSARAWNKVYLKYTAATPGAVTLAVYDDGITPTLLATPALSATTQLGFTAEVDLSGIDLDAHPALRFRVTLDGSGPTFDPTIDDLLVTWSPLSRIDVGFVTGGAATTCTGDTVTVDLPISVSFIRAEGLVVKLDKPTIDNFTHTSANLEVVSVSHAASPTSPGRINTGLPISFGDLTVQNGEVYWAFNSPVAAGSSLVLSVTYRVPGGIDGGTRFHVRAHAAATNASSSTTPDLVIEAQASSHPRVEVRYATLYASTTTTYAAPGETIGAHLRVSNDGGACAQTMHDVIVVDSLATFGAGNNLAFTNPPFAISDAGVYVPANTSQTFLGRSVTGPAVVWTTPSLAAGTAFERSYRLTLDRAAPFGDLALGTLPARTATVVATFDNASASDSRSITVGLPDDPTGIFATGQSYLGITEIGAGRDDLASLVVPTGSPFTYVLRAKNNGLSELNDVFMFFKVPAGLDFLDAGLNAEGDLFFSATIATYPASAPPDFVAGTLGPSWDIDPDALGGPVRWVAVRTDLVSTYFGAVGPNAINAEIDVVEAIVDGACEPRLHEGIGAFYIAAYTPVGALSPVPNLGATIVTDTEPLRTAPSQPRLGFAVRNDLGQRLGAGPISYTFQVANDGSSIDTIDIGRDAVLTIDLPQVELGQGPQFLDFVSINPVDGNVDLSNLAAGHITVRWATLAARSSRTVQLVLNWPAGGLDQAVAELRAGLSVNDDVCAPQFASGAATTTLQVRPALNIDKQVDVDNAEAGSTLFYRLTVTNNGDGAATNTIVFDRIPTGLRFDRLVDTGLGGTVYVSNKNPPALPSTFTNLGQFNAALVDSGLFVPANKIAGTWFSPYGGNTTWVAIDFDDTSLNPPRLSTGDSVSAIILVTVGPNAPLTAFNNRAAVDADNVTAAVSRAARTTLTGAPIARIVRTTPEIIAGNETFTYQVAISNGSTVTATQLSLTETLPAGLTYVSSTFAWDANANPNPTVVPTTNPDGTHTWDLTAVSGPLNSRAGGIITITAHADPNLANGAELTLTSLGTSANANVPGGTTTSAASVVTVSIADVAVDAALDRTDPIANDRLTLSLTVDNLGLHHADDSGFTVRIPPDLTYVPGSAFIGSGGYTLASGSGPSLVPVMSGNTLIGYDLTWTAAFAHAGQPDGRLPGDSGPVHVTLQLDVANGTPANTLLPITVTATTSTGQGGEIANDSKTINARTPKADPNVANLAPATVRPGDSATIVVRYGNATRQPAGHTAVVFELPHDGNDLTTTLVSATALAGETLYYRTGLVGGATPNFDPQHPASNGWFTNPAATGGAITHIAIDAQSIPGNTTRNVIVRTSFVSPGGNIATGGTHHDTCATLLPLGQDDAQLGNNSECRTIDIPAMNLVAELTSNPTGSVPGVVAGASVSHTATVSNSGYAPAFGTFLTFDRGLFAGTTGLPTYVDFVTSGGDPSTAIGPNGVAITQRVPVTAVGDRIYIGRHNGNASDPLDYRNIGLRSDDHIAFVFTSQAPTSTANKTQLTATLTVGTDYSYDYNPGTTDPEPASDNVATASVTVYRPDLFVAMDATNATTGVASPVSVGERINWDVSYNNVGDIAADGVTLTSSIAGGTGFVIGSLTDVPFGFTIEYLGPNGWSYQPTGTSGTVDSNVRALRLVGASLPAPMNVSYVASPAALAAGTTGNTRYTDGRIVATTRNGDTWTSEIIGASETIAQWTRVQLGEREGTDPLIVRVIDPTTGQTVPGFEAIPADASNTIDISGISATAHPTLQFEVKMPGISPVCNLAAGLSVRVESPFASLGYSPIIRSTVGKWAYGGTYGPVTRPALIWGPDGGGPEGWGVTVLPPLSSRPNDEYLALGGNQDDPTTVIGYGGNAIVSWTKGPTGWTIHEIAPGYYSQDGLGQGYSFQNELVPAVLQLNNRGYAYFDPTAVGGVRVLHDVAPGQPGAIPGLTSVYQYGGMFSLQGATGTPLFAIQATFQGGISGAVVWYNDGDLIRGDVLPGGNAYITDIDPDRPLIVGSANDDNGLRHPALWTRVDTVWNVEYLSSININDNARMLLSDGSVFGYGTPSDGVTRYGFFQKRSGSWVFTPFTADPTGNVSISESNNRLITRDGYMFGKRYHDGTSNLVLIHPPQPGDSEARLTDLGQVGDRFGNLGVEFEYNPYFGDNMLLGYRWTAYNEGHMVVWHVDGETATEYDADPNGLGGRWHDPYYHMNRRGHAIRGVNVPNTGYATWAWVPNDAGGTLVDTYPAGFTGGKSNVLPTPDAEVFAYGSWSQGRLFGCGMGSNASFGGFAVGYRTDTSPSFAFDTEVLPGLCQTDLSASTTAHSANPDNNNGNDTASASIAFSHVELELTLTAQKAVVAPGGFGTGYQMQIINHGPGTATGIVLTLDGTFITPSPRVIELNGVELLPGQVYPYGWGQGGNQQEGDILAFSASLTSSGFDCDLSDNRQSSTILVSSSPNAYVELEAPTVAFVGQPFPLTVRYGNNGGVTIPGGVVDIALPPNLSLVVPGSGTLAIPELSSGAIGPPITIMVVANGNLLGQSATTSATIVVANDLLPGDDEAFRTTSFQDGGGQLGVAMFADRASVAVGDQAGFVVLFDNHGFSTATQTTLVATLPADSDLVPGSTTGTYNAGNRTITWNLGELDPEQHGAVGFTVVANSAGTLTASADIDAAADDSSDTHAEASVAASNSVVRIIASVDHLTTTTTPGVLDWVIVVSNDTSNATSVALADLVPSGTSYVAGSISGPSASDSNTSNLNWNVPLAPGASATLHFSTTTPTTLGNFVNNATSTSVSSNASPVVASNASLPTLVTSASAQWLLTGDALVVTIAYANPGAPLVGATLRQLVGPDFAILSRGGAIGSGELLTWPLGDLASGQSGTVTFTLAANDAGAFVLDRASIIGSPGPIGSPAAPPQLSNSLVGVAVAPCDDPDPCTVAGIAVENEGCVLPPAPDGTACSDNLPCTAEACQAGVCAALGATSCDDENACTTDSCDPEDGCQHEDVSCDDGVGCTTDVCNPLVGCEYPVTPHFCDDSNVCQPSVCDPEHVGADPLTGCFDSALADGELAYVYQCPGLGNCGGNTLNIFCYDGQPTGTDGCPDPFANASNETCNGRDDDCDGVVDDHIPASNTQGACADNTVICNGTSSAPSPDNYVPRPDICNGIDDNCNGFVDDGAAVPADNVQGQCQYNVKVCLGEGGLADAPGNYVPTDETCNGFDDDCDGQTDEGLLPYVTTCGQGVCAGQTGLATCIGGTLQDSCNPLAGAIEESCNGLDDDCDGSVDTRLTTCGYGACVATATDFCFEGEWTDQCVPALENATPEYCDNFDNDCDGNIDNDIQPYATTCGVGACAGNQGIATCVNGSIQDTCDPLAGASEEICDDLGGDEDCDGLGDASFIHCGFGVCATTGIGYCYNGTVSDLYCYPLTNESPEQCDNLDNDCDGTVDNDVPPSTIGCTMEGGCSGILPTTCDGSGNYVADPGAVCALASPISDYCDGQDNNCDGNIDEDFVSERVSCGEDACASGEGNTTCEGGVPDDDCEDLWTDIPDTTCSELSNLNVAYIVVTDGSGRAVGSIRCFQDLIAGTVACDTDPGTNRVTVSNTLLCEGVAP